MAFCFCKQLFCKQPLVIIIERQYAKNLYYRATDTIAGLWIPGQVPVLDHESRDRDVFLVRPTINLGKPRGVGKLERRRNREGKGKGRSVYEQPGAKVDGIAPRKRRDSK